MSHPLSRRTFVRSAAAGIALPLISTSRTRAAAVAEGELRIGAIGVGGRGAGDIRETTLEKARVVAICDVDAARLERAGALYPEARKFADWRELLQMEGLDAVTVSTPDHMHAPATLTAIRRGLHVMCQKPLTYSVWEARQIGLAAARHGVVTQMGNQTRSSLGSLITVELLRRKVVGQVRQVHVWTDRPIWPQGIDRPQPKPAPEPLAWDRWIGVAPWREYHDHLHPFAWRGWLDFGTGALGDIGCHAWSPLWDGLGLTAPTAVWSDGEGPHGDTYPKASIIHFTFPATAFTGGECELIWYDGGKLPDRSLFPFMPGDWEMPQNGHLVVGEGGSLYGQRLYPAEKFARYEYPKVAVEDHYMQWTLACLDRSRKTVSPFDAVAGPLTEAVLLGNIALRFPGRKLRWDNAALRFPGTPEADPYLRRTYRDGWKVEGLG